MLFLLWLSIWILSQLRKIQSFYETNFPSDIIFTKDDVSTSDDQVEKLTRKLNIHYRACIGSLLYLFSTRVYLIFSVRKLEKFSSNTGEKNMRHWNIFWNILGKIRLWDWSIMLIRKMQFYLTCRDKLVLRLRISLCFSLILVA